MGGISAGYADVLSINYTNPASYSNFKMYTEERSGRNTSGRVLLDVGIDYENRTLRNPNDPIKFSSSYGYFSHVQVGLPLNKNWGLSFGLRPVSRISYKIDKFEELTDPSTGKKIDSALTEFSGSGGSFLPNIGTGIAIKNFSIGGTISYFFGRREYSTQRTLYGDSLASYQRSNHTTRSYFGNVFFNAGAQYKIDINKETILRLGVSGNWKQDLNGSRDIIRETFASDPNGAISRVDSVYDQLDVKGAVVYPSSYTAGFVIDHTEEKGSGWLVGVDYVSSKWSDFRFFGEQDAVQNSWQLRVGAQLQAKPASNYLSNLRYRVGFFTGPDYISVGRELPQTGFTFGVGLPIANYNRLSPGQFTILNIGMEYLRRGTNSNVLKEDLFRFSVGLNFSDLWFNKRRYD
jgi:hypothetical protein